jgi:hypothetical protein
VFLGVKLLSPGVRDVSSILMLGLWCAIVFLSMVFPDTQWASPKNPQGV